MSNVTVNPSQEQTNQELRRYWSLFIVIIILSLSVVGLSLLKISPHLKLPLILAIALFQGIILAAYFMHLLNEQKLVYISLFLTVIFFVGLVILPVSTYNSTPNGTSHTHTSVIFPGKHMSEHKEAPVVEHREETHGH